MPEVAKGILMIRKPFFPIIAAAFALSMAVGTLLLGQVASDSARARQEKNLRYNGGRCDLTQAAGDHECFFEQYEPRALPLIPLKESTVVVVAQVISVEPYLSTDRTHIYSEITMRVEETFKKPGGLVLAPNQTLVVDQIGGALKTPSGQTLHDNTRSGFMGKPRVGGMYVFFLVPTHGGKDLSILMAYELRDGKVFKLTEDGSPSSVLISKFPKEESFLQTLRRSASSPDPERTTR